MSTLNIRIEKISSAEYDYVLIIPNNRGETVINLTKQELLDLGAEIIEIFKTQHLFTENDKSNLTDYVYNPRAERWEKITKELI